MRNGVSAISLHRSRTATARRRMGTTLPQAVAVVLLALWAALGVQPPASAAGGDDVIKVFVVKDPAQTGGQLPTLQSIGASTLRDPARAGEIFNLNRGLAQPDGGALTSPTDQLHPGWILRLPPDAAGPDVQLARMKGGQDMSPPPGSTTITTRTTVLTVPLPAALAVVGAVLLALVTAGIVARNRVRKAFAPITRAFRRLGDGAARRRRFQARRLIGRRFADDADSVRRAYATVSEFSATKEKPEKPVYALRVDSEGATVWLAAAETMNAPWTNIDDTRWRRPAGAGTWLNPGSDGGGTPVGAANLVRVGTDTDDEPVFVDLSRLDGILSVTGDHAVARDVVHNLLAEIARSRPNTPVTVLRGTDGAPPIAVPPGLQQVTRIEGTAAPASIATVRGTVHGAASRRPVTGLVVMAGTPTEREAAELAALCGPGGARWTGIVCGEAAGAHWRWHTDTNGHVDIPVLGVKLTVPA